jgi:hypothetical protein
MRIQQSSSVLPTSAPSQDIPRLARQFKSQIDTLTSQLQNLLTAPEQSEDPTFLTSVKNTLLSLAETSKQINGE